MATTAQEITALKNRATALEASTSSLAAKDGSLSAELAVIKSRLTTAENSLIAGDENDELDRQTLTDYGTRLDMIQGGLSTVSTSVNTLKSQATSNLTSVRTAAIETPFGVTSLKMGTVIGLLTTSLGTASTVTDITVGHTNAKVMIRGDTSGRYSGTLFDPTGEIGISDVIGVTNRVKSLLQSGDIVGKSGTGIVTAVGFKGALVKNDDTSVGIDTIVGDIAALKSGATATRGDIVALTGRVVSLETLPGEISTFESRLSTVSGGVTTLQSGLAAAGGKISLLESGLATANTRVGAAESSLAASNTRVGVVETSLAATNTRVGAAESGLAAANTRVVTVETDLTAVKSGLVTADASLTSTNKRIGVVEIDLTAVKSGLATAEVNLSAATGNIGTLQTGLSAAVGRIAAAETGLSSTSGKVAVLDSGLKSVNTRVDNIVAGVVDLSGVESRLTTIDNDIELISGDLTAAEGRIEAVEGSVTAVNGEITTVKGDIVKANGEITTVKGDIVKANGEITTVKDDIARVNGEIGTFRTELEDVNTRVESIISEVDTSDIVTKIVANATYTILNVDRSLSLTATCKTLDIPKLSTDRVVYIRTAAEVSLTKAAGIRFTSVNNRIDSVLYPGTYIFVWNTVQDVISIIGGSPYTGKDGNTYVGELSHTVGGGGQNTSFGFEAFKLGTGDNNTSVGYRALMLNGDSTRDHPGFEITDNTAVGYLSMGKNHRGACNTAIGSLSLHDIISGSNNVAVGYSSLGNNGIGSYNIAIGTTACSFGYEASNNVGIGYSASYYNKKSFNTAVGDKAMFIFSGYENTAIGNSSLAISNEHIFFNRPQGNNNAALGSFSLFKGGDRNVAVGHRAHSHNNPGRCNVTVGATTGGKDDTGNEVPSAPRAVNEVDCFTTSIGFNSKAVGTYNSCAIGNGVTVTSNNLIQLGNAEVTKLVTPASAVANSFRSRFVSVLPAAPLTITLPTPELSGTPGVVRCDTSNGDVTIVIPPPAGFEGSIYRITKPSLLNRVIFTISAGTVVSRSTDLVVVDDTTTVIQAVAKGCYTLISDGINWYIE